MAARNWHAAVSLGEPRLVTLSYRGFDAASQTGQLVVNSDSVPAAVVAFRALYQARSPVRQMRQVDYYSGDDEKSMAADNTSAFNCRLVPGTTMWSQHAHGRAVDMDPREARGSKTVRLTRPAPGLGLTGTDRIRP